MPMRAYRASTAYAAAHVTNNLWLWIGISTAVTAVLALAVWRDPQSNVWGHLAPIAGMVAGTLVMMQSQVGYVAPDVPDEDAYAPPPMA